MTFTSLDNLRIRAQFDSLSKLKLYRFSKWVHLNEFDAWLSVDECISEDSMEWFVNSLDVIIKYESTEINITFWHGIESKNLL